MAMFPIMNGVVPQLSFHVKASGSFISFLDVLTLLAVFRLSAHPISVPVLLPSTMLNSVGELRKNLQPSGHLARRLCTLAQPYQRCMVHS